MSNTINDIAATITGEIAKDLIVNAVEAAKKKVKIFSNYPPHFVLIAIIGNAIGLILEAMPREDISVSKKYINNIMNEIK